MHWAAVSMLVEDDAAFAALMPPEKLVQQNSLLCCGLACQGFLAVDARVFCCSLYCLQEMAQVLWRSKETHNWMYSRPDTWRHLRDQLLLPGIILPSQSLWNSCRGYISNTFWCLARAACMHFCPLFGNYIFLLATIMMSPVLHSREVDIWTRLLAQLLTDMALCLVSEHYSGPVTCLPPAHTRHGPLLYGSSCSNSSIWGSQYLHTYLIHSESAHCAAPQSVAGVDVKPEEKILARVSPLVPLAGSKECMSTRLFVTAWQTHIIAKGSQAAETVPRSLSPVLHDVPKINLLPATPISKLWDLIQQANTGFYDRSNETLSVTVIPEQFDVQKQDIQANLVGAGLLTSTTASSERIQATWNTPSTVGTYSPYGEHSW